MIEKHERPIAKCQAIKVKQAQTGKGLFITLLVKEELPPEEFLDGFSKLKCGDVFNFYGTVDGE